MNVSSIQVYTAEKNICVDVLFTTCLQHVFFTTCFFTCFFEKNENFPSSPIGKYGPDRELWKILFFFEKTKTWKCSRTRFFNRLRLLKLVVAQFFEGRRLALARTNPYPLSGPPESHWLGGFWVSDPCENFWRAPLGLQGLLTQVGWEGAPNSEVNSAHKFLSYNTREIKHAIRQLSTWVFKIIITFLSHTHYL